MILRQEKTLASLQTNSIPRHAPARVATHGQLAGRRQAVSMMAPAFTAYDARP
jgi:hypothetical protein